MTKQMMLLNAQTQDVMKLKPNARFVMRAILLGARENLASFMVVQLIQIARTQRIFSLGAAVLKSKGGTMPSFKNSIMIHKTLKRITRYLKFSCINTVVCV